MKKVTVRLQEGVVIATTDPDAPVLPAAVWREIVRVGFKPVEMEVRAKGSFEEGAFVIDGRRWPLSGPSPADRGRPTARLKALGGAEDPPWVKVLE